MSAAPKDIAAIHAYHAHVYYDPEQTRAQAALLRAWVEARFPSVRMGRWHDVKVGPHPRAMYQIAFETALFPTLVPFLMMNRQGLTVLVHPESGRPRDDHLIHALWLGAVLELNGAVLPEIEEGTP
jgi:aromatic ring-cleaving dioxygenase